MLSVAKMQAVPTRNGLGLGVSTQKPPISTAFSSQDPGKSSPDQFQPSSRPKAPAFGSSQALRFAGSVQGVSSDYGVQVMDNRVRFKLWAPSAQDAQLVRIRHLSSQEAKAAERLDQLRKEKALDESILAFITLPSSDDRIRNLNEVGRERLEYWQKRLGSLKSRLSALTGEIDRQASQVPTLDARTEATIPMSSDGHGSFSLERQDFRPGTLYLYKLKGKNGSESQLLPDPRSRYQPEDVHGPSQVVDLRFNWSSKAEATWNTAIDVRKLMTYRLHIGTFTPEGTIKAAMDQLEEIKRKGYTAIELMPVQEFAGQRNWGYDMVDYFAVEHAYGQPRELQALINKAHELGLKVMLDAVYNHIGPEGNYFSQFDAGFVNPRSTPWGDGFNYGEYSRDYHPDLAQRNTPDESRPALNFVLDNARSWVTDFHVDGFRFDQTEHIPREALQALSQSLYDLRPTPHQRINANAPDRPLIYLSAEDGREQNDITSPSGLKMKSKWNFNFYHMLRSLLTGTAHMGPSVGIQEFAGFLWNGFRWGDGHENTLWNGVLFPESHDEAGNHDGSRMQKLLANSPGKQRISAVLPYIIPGIPLNFMGHEEGEQSPFYFFVDYGDANAIRNLVAGRWNSPQPGFATDESTFQACKLSHRSDKGLQALSERVLALRKSVPALWQGERYANGQQIYDVQSKYLGSNVIAIHRKGFVEPEEGINKVDEVFMVLNDSNYDYMNNFQLTFPPGQWKEILNTEDRRFSTRKISTNEGRTFSGGEAPITLPANSILIFQKQ